MRGVVLALLAGCSFSPGHRPTDLPDDATVDTPDGIGDDGMPDTPLCQQWTPAPKHFMPCSIAAPTGDLNVTQALSPWKLDTASGTLSNNATSSVPVAQIVVTQSGGVDALVLSVDSLNVEIGATLDVVGARPLVIASFNGMTIAGVIDATSKVGASAGAGADPAACATSIPTSGGGALGVGDASGGGGSGGGGGGGFRGTGGIGGPGDSGAENAGGGGGGPITFPMIVRGGCAGGASGVAGPSGANPTLRSAGGSGGGAIQLTARTSIVMSVGGRVLAGGAGGAGSATGDASGGGGGGAGGYLGLQAVTISITSAVVAANGGGGGGSAPFAGTGLPGQDGQPTAVAAAGGPLSSCSNAGGVGAAGPTLDGTTASQTAVSCGGGGGGGAAGFIGIFTTSYASASSTISPAEQLNPF